MKLAKQYLRLDEGAESEIESLLGSEYGIASDADVNDNIMTLVISKKEAGNTEMEREELEATLQDAKDIKSLLKKHGLKAHFNIQFK